MFILSDPKSLFTFQLHEYAGSNCIELCFSCFALVSLLDLVSIYVCIGHLILVSQIFLFIFLPTALLRKDSHYQAIHVFKVYTSVVFSILIYSQSCKHCQDFRMFITPKRNLVTTCHQLPPPVQPWAVIGLSVITNWLILNILCDGILQDVCFVTDFLTGFFQSSSE